MDPDFIVFLDGSRLTVFLNGGIEVDWHSITTSRLSPRGKIAFLEDCFSDTRGISLVPLNITGRVSLQVQVGENTILKFLLCVVLVSLHISSLDGLLCLGIIFTQSAMRMLVVLLAGSFVLSDLSSHVPFVCQIISFPPSTDSSATYFSLAAVCSPYRWSDSCPVHLIHGVNIPTGHWVEISLNLISNWFKASGLLHDQTAFSVVLLNHFTSLIKASKHIRWLD